MKPHTDILIDEIPCAYLRDQAEADGLYVVTYLGDNGLTGDRRITAYFAGDVRVLCTNGEPVWEDTDPEAFADMSRDIRSMHTPVPCGVNETLDDLYAQLGEIEEREIRAVEFGQHHLLPSIRLEQVPLKQAINKLEGFTIYDI